jgi:YgiT-type zinc finger domain-containing protein
MQSEAPGNSCEICGGPLEERRVLARFRYKGETIYIENVPAWVCKHCGEQYYDAPVYKRLEEIAQRRDQIQRVISFPIVEFDVALTK